jgi:uncharacterized protein (TIGR02391 family)
MDATSMSITELIPNADRLLELTVEELAGLLLEHLNSQQYPEINRWHICQRIGHEYKDARCKPALLEAWSYLESQGLVIPGYTNGAGIWSDDIITRRGKAFKTHIDFDSFRKASLFPKEFIHPDLAKEVYSLFLRGDYETAIFKAFKTVEVKVREGCVKKSPAFDTKLIGTNLMRKAFDPETGPLRDSSEHPDERQALQGLFANAISRFKNPASHRPVSIEDPTEAVEIIQFASHLLRVVDDRTQP